MDFMKLNDYNAENVSLSQVSTRQGKRWSTASAYLLKAVKRENLDILTHVHCCRVVFDEEKQVHGVVTKRSSSLDKEEFIKGKEVVLSAGTVGSAQILLLSGIGPREELDKHEIPVIVDLSGVGKNLQDHLMASLVYLPRILTAATDDITLENLQQSTTQEKNPFTMSVAQCLSWYKLNENGNLSLD
ncbi:unnamed protein product [Rotaria sp. Silwood1]|nr:unnamed protein product [Rotaria sp. Silwood1]